MEIKEIQVNKIKPDLNQPRKSFDKVRLNEMAQSIKTEGVINPIEIDKGYIIITGEMRWRSAKLAGLKTVPCKILKISDKDRFMRQVIENIHHNTMSAWDTAKAMEKLLLLSAADSKEKIGRGGYNDKGITWLSEKLGKSRSSIASYLDILEASKPIIKAVRDGLSHTSIQEIKRVEPKFKKELEDKVVDKNIKHREGIRKVVSAMNKFPDDAKKIIKQDYSGCGTVDEVVDKIHRVIPSYSETPLSDALSKNLLPIQQINGIATKLYKWCRENPADELNKAQLAKAVKDMVGMKRSIDNWANKTKALSGKIVEGKIVK